jgi:hypothetical protein
MGASKAALRGLGQAVTGEAWLKSARQSYSPTAMRCVVIKCLDLWFTPESEASFSGNPGGFKPILANGKEACGEKALDDIAWWQRINKLARTQAFPCRAFTRKY